MPVEQPQQYGRRSGHGNLALLVFVKCHGAPAQHAAGFALRHAEASPDAHETYSLSALPPWPMPVLFLFLASRGAGRPVLTREPLLAPVPLAACAKCLDNPRRRADRGPWDPL